jgi:hypothetical protein
MMKCVTVRAELDNAECPFMTKKGCSYNGGSCNPVVEDCTGCNRIVQMNGQGYCSSFPDPPKKWSNGVCNLASHISKEKARETIKKLNPLKASKRGLI